MMPGSRRPSSDQGFDFEHMLINSTHIPQGPGQLEYVFPVRTTGALTTIDLFSHIARRSLTEKSRIVFCCHVCRAGHFIICENDIHYDSLIAIFFPVVQVRKDSRFDQECHAGTLGIRITDQCHNPARVIGHPTVVV